jgi:hypothetical protein
MRKVVLLGLGIAAAAVFCSLMVAVVLPFPDECVYMDEPYVRRSSGVWGWYTGTPQGTSWYVLEVYDAETLKTAQVFPAPSGYGYINSARSVAEVSYLCPNQVTATRRAFRVATRIDAARKNGDGHQYGWVHKVFGYDR